MAPMGEKKKHTIDRAPTGRATCKGCGAPIAKDDLRFGFVDFSFNDSGSYKYYHLACGESRKPDEFEEARENSAVPKKELEAVTSGPAKSSAPAIAKSALPKWLTKAEAPDDTWPFAEATAPPVTEDGKAIDAESTSKLVKAMHASTVKTKKKSALSLEQFEEWLGKDSLREFVWRLFVSWDNTDGHMRHKWLFTMLTRYADDAMAFKFRDLIAQWVKDNKKNAVEAGLEVLAESGTPTSLMIVSDLAQRFAYKGAYNLAAQTLAQVAKSQGTTVDELEDTLVPTLGLDKDGSRTFDFGKRKFTLRVGAELEVEISAGTERLKALPPSKAGDDEEKVKDARAAFDLLKNELAKAFKVHVIRLERAMSTSRRWHQNDWDVYLRTQPVMKHLVRRFVWGTYDGVKLTGTFTTDEQGKLIGLDLAPFAVPKNAKIGLVHPIELDAATRNAWGTVLNDYEIIQPFAQLGRALHEPRETTGTAIAPLTPTKIPLGPLHGVMNARGWFKGAQDQKAYMRILYFGKRFGDLEARIQLDPGIHVAGYDQEDQTITGAVVLKGGKPLAIDSIPKIVLSEVLHDMESLANAAADPRSSKR
jgi:hypothetical protein